MSIILQRAAAAELLFGAAQIPASTVQAGRLIAAEYRRRHGDLTGAAEEMAQAFGDHPSEARARMRACLAVAPTRTELPDSYGPAWLRGDEADLLAEVLLAESAGYDDGEPEPHAGLLLAAMGRAQLAQDFPPKLYGDAAEAGRG